MGTNQLFNFIYIPFIYIPCPNVKVVPSSNHIIVYFTNLLNNNTTKIIIYNKKDSLVPRFEMAPQKLWQLYTLLNLILFYTCSCVHHKMCDYNSIHDKAKVKMLSSKAIQKSRGKLDTWFSNYKRITIWSLAVLFKLYK